MPMSTTTEALSATVQTTTGAVRGLDLEGTHVYLGIPYAAPPVGARYLAPPAAPERWDGVRDVTEFGPTAPQAADTTGILPQIVVPGDDYLNLNVYSPSPGATGLPVYVWIHGGGWVFGSNIDPTHGPAQLARRGMVVVAINYRLGFEGFLPLRDAPANLGVLDWLAALAWVQDNIAAFGGDPGQVTVGGYSAGAGSCHVLTTMPRAAGLFGRAIAMSGVSEQCVEVPEAEALGDRCMERLGVERTKEGLASTPAAERFAVQADMVPIIAPGAGALDIFHANSTSRTWLGPVVDGDVVPYHPMSPEGAAVGSDTAMLIGCTVAEMDALLGVLGGSIEREAAEQALREVGCTLDGAARWFAALDGRSPGQVLGAALTARWFRRSVLRVAETRAESTAPTFVYEFAWEPPTPLGAVHCIDVPFAFDTVDAEPHADVVHLFTGPTPPPSLAGDYSGAISRFVIDGDPGWPAYDQDDRHVMAFGDPSEVRRDPERDRLVLDIFGALP